MLEDELSSELEPIPEPSAADWFTGIVTTGVSGIPRWWAAPAAALFSLLTAPLLSRRREEWFERLRLKLNELQRTITKLTPEALSKDENFISALAQATQAALRTHEPEKLEALQNAVVTVARGVITRPPDFDADLELMFLNLLDNFTPTHLCVLRFCEDRSNSAEMERLRRQRDLSDQAVMDLLNRGLIRDTRPYVARNRDSYDALIVKNWEVGSLGKRFLRFISRTGAPPSV